MKVLSLLVSEATPPFGNKQLLNGLNQSLFVKQEFGNRTKSSKRLPETHLEKTKDLSRVLTEKAER